MELWGDFSHAIRVFGIKCQKESVTWRVALMMSSDRTLLQGQSSKSTTALPIFTWTLSICVSLRKMTTWKDSQVLLDFLWTFEKASSSGFKAVWTSLPLAWKYSFCSLFTFCALGSLLDKNHFRITYRSFILFSDGKLFSIYSSDRLLKIFTRSSGEFLRRIEANSEHYFWNIFTTFL